MFIPQIKHKENPGNNVFGGRKKYKVTLTKIQVLRGAQTTIPKFNNVMMAINTLFG